MWPRGYREHNVLVSVLHTRRVLAACLHLLWLRVPMGHPQDQVSADWHSAWRGQCNGVRVHGLVFIGERCSYSFSCLGCVMCDADTAGQQSCGHRLSCLVTACECTGGAWGHAALLVQLFTSTVVHCPGTAGRASSRCPWVTQSHQAPVGDATPG